MKLSHIFTERLTKKWPAYQIVYEWEDVISERLKLDFQYDRYFPFKVHENLIRRKWLVVYNALIRLAKCFEKQRENLSLWFVMAADTTPYYKIGKNTIPVIIDFWLVGDQIDAFIEAFKDVPLLLVTSKEVYDVLLNHNCPFPVEHWPLSYPDVYKSDNIPYNSRKYEFSIIGRPNPFFIRLLDEYSQKHPDFSYIRNNDDIAHRKYIDNKGNIVAEGDSREDYINMIKNTKISCYTTPGIDEAKKGASGYNQVTPRLFELLSNGCQVIGHYPDSSDTLWYDLQSIIPNVNNYEEFEKVLDDVREREYDMHRSSNFMEKHYTSVRVNSLVQILKKHEISIA